MRRFKKRSTKTGKYKSKLEAVTAKSLPKNARYEADKLKYFIVKHYIPDFTIVTKSGKTLYIEVKGYLRYEDQTKMRAVKLCNPDLDIRVFAPYDSRVQNSKMTISEWCTKHNFPCAIGKIPKKWFN